MKKSVAFSFGIFAALFALVLEFLFLGMNVGISDKKNFLGLGLALLSAIIIEEILKYIFIKKISLETLPSSVIFTNSIFFGIGFSLVEFFLNTIGQPFFASPFAHLGSFLTHISTAMIFGLYFSSQKRLVFFEFSTLFLAFAVHLLFNLAVENTVDSRVTVVSLLCLIIFLATLKKLNYNSNRSI